MTPTTAWLASLLFVGAPEGGSAIRALQTARDGASFPIYFQSGEVSTSLEPPVLAFEKLRIVEPGIGPRWLDVRDVDVPRAKAEWADAEALRRVSIPEGRVNLDIEFWTLDGAPGSLPSRCSREEILIVHSSWCVPCRVKTIALARKLGTAAPESLGLTILAVDESEDATLARAAARSLRRDVSGRITVGFGGALASEAALATRDAVVNWRAFLLDSEGAVIASDLSPDLVSLIIDESGMEVPR